MAVKVVYDATRGLVQENDTTGVGGFQIKDVSFTEGTDTFNAVVQAGVAAAAALPAVGVSLITSAVGNNALLTFCKVADGTVTGQQKTIIHLSDNAQGNNLVVRDSGDAADIVAAGTFGVGDVVVLIWSGTKWLKINETA